MTQFLTVLDVQPFDKVLDFGGSIQTWDEVPFALDITIFNLPPLQERPSHSRHIVQYMEGDGCAASDLPDQSFDIVFSNSVIEHVGASVRQR